MGRPGMWSRPLPEPMCHNGRCRKPCCVTGETVDYDIHVLYYEKYDPLRYSVQQLQTKPLGHEQSIISSQTILSGCLALLGRWVMIDDEGQDLAQLGSGGRSYAADPGVRSWGGGVELVIKKDWIVLKFHNLLNTR